MIYSFFFLVLSVFPVCWAALFLHNYIQNLSLLSSFRVIFQSFIFPLSTTYLYNMKVYFSVTFLLILFSECFSFLFILDSFPFCTTRITCFLISFFQIYFFLFCLYVQPILCYSFYFSYCILSKLFIYTHLYCRVVYVYSSLGYHTFINLFLFYFIILLFCCILLKNIEMLLSVSLFI